MLLLSSFDSSTNTRNSHPIILLSMHKYVFFSPNFNINIIMWNVKYENLCGDLKCGKVFKNPHKLITLAAILDMCINNNDNNIFIIIIPMTSITIASHCRMIQSIICNSSELMGFFFFLPYIGFEYLV